MYVLSRHPSLSSIYLGFTECCYLLLSLVLLQVFITSHMNKPENAKSNIIRCRWWLFLEMSFLIVFKKNKIMVLSLNRMEMSVSWYDCFFNVYYETFSSCKITNCINQRKNIHHSPASPVPFFSIQITLAWIKEWWKFAKQINGRYHNFLYYCQKQWLLKQLNFVLQFRPISLFSRTC